MEDYLEIYKKFADVKEVEDYISDVNALRYYYSSMQFEEMVKHIKYLMLKYLNETLVWNAVNLQQPQTYEQAYKNAENFLCAQGAKIVAKKVANYVQRLSKEENEFVLSKIKSIE